MTTYNVVAIKENGTTITSQVQSFREAELLVKEWVVDPFYSDPRNNGLIVKAFAGCYDLNMIQLKEISFN